MVSVDLGAESVPAAAECDRCAGTTNEEVDVPDADDRDNGLLTAIANAEDKDGDAGRGGVVLEWPKAESLAEDPPEPESSAGCEFMEATQPRPCDRAAAE